MLKPFNEIWTSLQTELQPFEERRADVYSRIKKALFIVIPLAIVMVIGAFAIFASTENGLVAGLFGVVGAAVCFGIYYFMAGKHYTAFINDFKTQVIGTIIQSIYPGFQYDHKAHISQEDYYRSKLFTRTCDRYRGEDLVWGKLDKTDIAFSELHTEYKTKDSKGNTSWHTIFKGLFMIMDSNKHFKGETYIFPDVAEGLFGGFGKWLQQKTDWMSSHGEVVYMENVEFEKQFKVMGSDQIEARYLITPAMMERILELKNKKKRTISLSFVGSSIFVAIQSGYTNLFEPSLRKSLNEPETVREFYDQMAACLEVVELLDLNTRIWTKE
jgi:hypothetical protein